MKKVLAFALVCCVLLSLAVGVQAEAEKTYALGIKMDDFTVTLNDGKEYNLYSLLGEKKAVLINFWASWCGPCKNEFPDMEKAYHELQDDIAVIALSAYKLDTMEKVAEVKKECQLTDLPLGLDIGLYNLFGFNGYPASVVIDRNGVICYAKTGGIPSKDHFIRLITPYIGEDYSEPVLLQEIPHPIVTMQLPEEADVKAALGMSDERLSILPIEDSTVWPFVPNDKGGVAASNTQIMDTKSELTIHVDAGAGLSFAYNAGYIFLREGLLDVSVDGQRTLSLPGSEDWENAYVALGDANAAHDVTFTYETYHDVEEPLNIAIKDITVLNDEELSALVGTEKKPANKLPGETAEFELISGNVKPVLFTSSDEPEGSGNACLTLDNELDFRVRVGEDINERIAFVCTRFVAYPLYLLPCDEDGYLLHWTNPDEGYQCDSIEVRTSIDGDSVGSHEIYESEAALNAWIAKVNERYPEVAMDWHYTDGSSKQDVQEAAPAAALPTESSYVIHVTDADGKPLEGVFIKFCDDETCQAIFTDENGLIMQTAAPKTYEVHVLMVPDGFLTDETAYIMPPEGGDLTIVLNK